MSTVTQGILNFRKISKMAESTVVFWISTDLEGEIKVDLDSAKKRNLEKLAVGMGDFERRYFPLSPSSSSISSESLLPLPSISPDDDSSIDDEFSEGYSELLLDSDDLSDTSFTSCVSNLSLKTSSSSSKTVKEEEILTTTEKLENLSVFGNIHNNCQAKKNEQRPSPPMPFSLKKHTSNSTRIPSLMGRPLFSPSSSRPSNSTSSDSSSTKKSNPLSKVNTNIGLYASAIKIPALPTLGSKTGTSENCENFQNKFSPRSPAQNGPTDKIKLAIITDTRGKMRFNFSNSTSSESWSIDGISNDFEKINVRKI